MLPRVGARSAGILPAGGYDERRIKPLRQTGQSTMVLGRNIPERE